MKRHTIKILTLALLLPASTALYALGNDMYNTNANSNQEMPAVDDTAIIAAINGKIVSNQAIKDLNVTVASNNGAVTLTGKVDTDSQAEILVETVESTKGVKDINTDNLQVTDSKQPIDDTIITGKVKGSFIREELFGTENIAPMSVSVETKNGVVYLTGTVDTVAEKNNAESIARSVKGVKSVDSSIEVRAE